MGMGSSLATVAGARGAEAAFFVLLLVEEPLHEPHASHFFALLVVVFVFVEVVLRRVDDGFALVGLVAAVVVGAAPAALAALASLAALATASVVVTVVLVVLVVVFFFFLATGFFLAGPTGVAVSRVS